MKSKSMVWEPGGGHIPVIVSVVTVGTGKGWGTACARGQGTGLCTGLSSLAQRPLGGVKEGI